MIRMKNMIAYVPLVDHEHLARHPLISLVPANAVL
jgi:hypothetical protein